MDGGLHARRQGELGHRGGRTRVRPVHDQRAVGLARVVIRTRVRMFSRIDVRHA